MRLTTRIHDRDAAGLEYVYPVVSRRARGVSIGVNLNPNNACNWRCVYCQVPDLVYGKGPPIHLGRLAAELDAMLTAVVQGDYMQRHVPEDSRRLNDLAFSGNGEPTSSPQFAAAIELAAEAMKRFGLQGRLPLILITNGSLVHLDEVQVGLRRLQEAGGEIWFKLDAATDAGIERMNSAKTGVERARKNLRIAAKLCPTWIQTMALARAGQPPDEEACQAWLELLSDELNRGLELSGVHLYGLERVSHQPEASEISALPREWMEAWAERIRGLGLEVQLSV